MIPLPSGTKIWLVAGITDMRNGFNGLAAKVQTALKDDPMSGHVFIFRGRSGSQVKLLWSTGDGLCLLYPDIMGQDMPRCCQTKS
ncbi:IS66 family insertion sequence element accessory protein TnpB [Escherichia coli]|nr:IS66 family insertion sequence element accessory protein TnpB [Escherichia coli]